MGLSRTAMPAKVQLLAVMAFALAMLFIENQIHSLEESRAKLELTIARHEVAEVEQRHSEGAWRESGPRAEKDDAVVIYNRVPKTASTSFTNIAYDLCGKNGFHVLHINTTKNNPVMSLQDQVRFVRNVTSWKEMKPGFYHGHVAYLDFSKYGAAGKPMYINVVRDPIERLVSYYYFLRFGDDYRPALRRRKQGDKKVFCLSNHWSSAFWGARTDECDRVPVFFQTFDECVSSGGPDCAPDKLWLQIPFFCGHHPECCGIQKFPPNISGPPDEGKLIAEHLTAEVTGSPCMLRTRGSWLASRVQDRRQHMGPAAGQEQPAERVVYLLVGVTEELEDFVMILEAALPRFFRGATELYRTGKKSHLRRTTDKKPPTKETITKLQRSDIWKMENEFYEFALEQFQFARAHAVREKDGELEVLAQSFFYEKIYPKAN